MEMHSSVAQHILLCFFVQCMVLPICFSISSFCFLFSHFAPKKFHFEATGMEQIRPNWLLRSYESAALLGGESVWALLLQFVFSTRKPLDLQWTSWEHKILIGSGQALWCAHRGLKVNNYVLYGYGLSIVGQLGVIQTSLTKKLWL